MLCCVAVHVVTGLLLCVGLPGCAVGRGSQACQASGSLSLRLDCLALGPRSAHPALACSFLRQALLPWVTGAFSTEEKDAMMDSLREATKNTMFDQWLDAVQGGHGSDTGTPRLAPPSSAAAAAAGAGELPGPQQQHPQQQQVDAHMQLAEIAGYLADGGDTASAAGGAGGAFSAAAAAAAAAGGGAAPGLSAAGLHHHQQQQQHQLTLQQQTEVSGTVAESTNYVPGWEDIFNINQKQLEGAIRRVSNDPNLEPQRKAYLIQNIMVSRYIVAQQRRMRMQGSLTAAGSAAVAAAAAATAAAGGDDTAGHSHSHGAGGCHHHHRHHHHHGHQQLGPVVHQQQLLQPPPPPVATHPKQVLLPSSTGGDAPAAAAAPSSAAAAAAAGGGVAAAAAAAGAVGGSVARQTYTDASSGILGCQHYRRATRLVAPCCNQVFTCRCGRTPGGHCLTFGGKAWTGGCSRFRPTAGLAQDGGAVQHPEALIDALGCVGHLGLHHAFCVLHSSTLPVCVCCHLGARLQSPPVLSGAVLPTC